jgi:hypothetical protein
MGSRIGVAKIPGSPAPMAFPSATARANQSLQHETAAGPGCTDWSFAKVPLSSVGWPGAPWLQAKLAVGAVDDPLEREADAAADRVMRMPNPSGVTHLQRKCSLCQEHEEEGHTQLARKESVGAAQSAAVAPAIVHDVLSQPGLPLDPQDRAFFEPRFGRDFSDVRVHTDGLAAQSAEAVNALAYTVGRDVVWGPSRPAASSAMGRRLLAHELAHVVQQTGAKPWQHSRGSRETGQSVLAPRHVQRAPKAPPPPVAGGNILYVGMNNYMPEVAKLDAQYKGTSVSVTKVTVTEGEDKTDVGGTTYDLTDPKGIKAFAASVSSDAKVTAAVEALITGQDSENRDDLAHVIAVYAACEKDGVDRMARVVLSGHSYGTKVYNEDVKGAIYFSALVTLAGIFPKAAGQTKHLMVLACLAGAEDKIKDVYLKAFPNLKTVWGWTSSCPTGAGAAAALGTWSQTTDKDPAKLDKPPSGQANWAVGVYQTDDPVDAPVLLAGLKADETKFNEYFAGTKVDKDSHAGFLFDYYRRARTAEETTSAIVGADHTYVAQHADQSFRLRFWPAMVSNFWKKNGPAVTKGYGTATVPSYGGMSRKDALAAIAKFSSDATGTAADKTEALRLLTALRDLDPAVISDNWLTP